MKRLLFLLGFGAVNAAAQTLVLNPLGTLPALISETSGLETAAGGAFWTHNDSGGEPALYRINSIGSITRTLHVSNADNVDWEDLARDAAGNLYIGDFGNNSNNRTDLRIYKIPDPDTWATDTVAAEIIEYAYPDQDAFPPPPAKLNFDMEAMVHIGESLYLFSKNRTEPFTGYSRIYRLPDQAGSYTAQLVDSFYAGPGPALNYWVTGADISPDGEKLVLLGYDKLWLFTCRNGRSFLDGNIRQVGFGSSFTQKEGIVFSDDQTLAITDEALLTFVPARLYHADVSSFLPASCCPAPEALSAVPVTPGKLLYRWKPVAGRDGYRLRLNGSDGSNGLRQTTDTALLIPGLNPGTIYRAYVQARCGNLTSPPSDTVTLVALRTAANNETCPEVRLVAAGDQLVIQVPEKGSLQLFSTDGRLLLEKTVQPGEILSMRELPSGMLLWRWAGDSSSSTGKFFSGQLCIP